MFADGLLQVTLERDLDQIFMDLQGGPFIRHILQPITKSIPYIITQLIVVYGIHIYTCGHLFRGNIICIVRSLLLTHTDWRMAAQRMMYNPRDVGVAKENNSDCLKWKVLT
jgi:hypothetical protein